MRPAAIRRPRRPPPRASRRRATRRRCRARSTPGPGPTLRRAAVPRRPGRRPALRPRARGSRARRRAPQLASAPPGAVAPTTSPTRPSGQRSAAQRATREVKRLAVGDERSWRRPARRVARSREEVDEPIGVGQERLDGVLAEVRRQRDRVRVEVAEQALRVALGGRADVAPLRVEDADERRRGTSARTRSSAAQPADAEGLEEGDVDLHRHGVRGRPPRSGRARTPRCPRRRESGPSGSWSGWGSIPRHSGAPSASRAREGARAASVIRRAPGPATGTAAGERAGSPAACGEVEDPQPEARHATERRRARGCRRGRARRPPPGSRPVGVERRTRSRRTSRSRAACGRRRAARVAPTRRASATTQAGHGEDRLEVPGTVRRQPLELVGERPVEVAGRQHEVDHLAAGTLHLDADGVSRERAREGGEGRHERRPTRRGAG